MTRAPALQLSYCPAALENVSAALFDRWEQHVWMGLSLWQKFMELLQRNAARKKKKASVLEQRKLRMWSNIPAKYMHTSNWWLASFLAALL